MTRLNAARLLRAGGLALFTLVVAACSSAGGGNGGDGTGGSANRITREQILLMPDGTALDVVRRYRSQWLRARSQGTFARTRSDPLSGDVTAAPDTPQVFLDELRLGDIDALGQISSANIESIEYITASDATTRYGTGYSGGIIRVNTIGR